MTNLIEFVANHFLFLACICAAIWVITTVNSNTGETHSKTVETSQTRKELMQRNAAAIQKNTGLPVESKKVRNGFWNFNSKISVNGQIKKK